MSDAADGGVEAVTSPPRRRFKLTIAYDGTNFCGFQRQLDPIRTVQRDLELAAAPIVGEPVIIHGSSRTDTGVHARGQVAHWDSSTLLEPERLRRAINSRLAADVMVRSIEAVPSTFDASRAVQKKYRYSIWAGADRPLFARQFVCHHYRPLDVARMHAAARHFVGTHDFLAFQSGENERLTTVRTIFDCSVRQRGKLITISVVGSGFLYHMVRNMAGTILEAGRTEKSERRAAIQPEDIPAIIASLDRRRAGPCAPAQGLCLEWIRFAPLPELSSETATAIDGAAEPTA
jgi:tRNA pseudouridine38-40 synthase